MRPSPGTTAPSHLPPAPATQAALALLLGNFRCAELLHRSVWDFACGLPQLRELGLSDEVLDALIAQGYIVHQAEPLRPKGRSWQSPATGSASWSAHSRFVLAAEGAALALQVNSPRTEAATGNPPDQAAGERHPAPEKPEWEPTLRELRYRGRLVKRFRRAAVNQECVLNAFQELGWPGRVDDPLPKERGIDGEERLRETVKSLNRRQRGHVLQFRVEADGRGVLWAVMEGG